jgi:hypothetical protein
MVATYRHPIGGPEHEVAVIARPAPSSSGAILILLSPLPSEILAGNPGKRDRARRPRLTHGDDPMVDLQSRVVDVHVAGLGTDVSQVILGLLP